MSRIDNDRRAHDALIEATRAVRAYAGSDVSRAVVEMLDSMMASYCLDLIYVKPEGLIRLQSALQQVTALRDVLSNDGMDIPKI